MWNLPEHGTRKISLAAAQCPWRKLVAGLKGAGVKIFSGGSMAMDLTQTSFSTVPSVDIELGDKLPTILRPR